MPPNPLILAAAAHREVAGTRAPTQFPATTYLKKTVAAGFRKKGISQRSVNAAQSCHEASLSASAIMSVPPFFSTREALGQALCRFAPVLERRHAVNNVKRCVGKIERKYIAGFQSHASGEGCKPCSCPIDLFGRKVDAGERKIGKFAEQLFRILTAAAPDVDTCAAGFSCSRNSGKMRAAKSVTAGAMNESYA